MTLHERLREAETENARLRGELAGVERAHALQRERWRNSDLHRRLDRIRQNIAGLRPGDAETLADLQSRLVQAEIERDALVNLARSA